MRISLSGIAAALALGVMMGCSGPQFTGYCPASCQHPAPPTTPAITYIQPDMAISGGAGFNLAVTGEGFTSNSVVEWNANPLPTTFVSATELQAQVPSAIISNPGNSTISLQTPNFGFSNGKSFLIESGAGFTFSEVPVQANDMVWDSQSQQIYLSVQSGNGVDANTITALNPGTGQLGISQNAVGEPYRLAVASDGSYLYAGINAAGLVQRFTLPGLGQDIQISLGSNTGSGGVLVPADIEVSPINPRTIAVLITSAQAYSSSVGAGNNGVAYLQNPDYEGAAIYDDAAVRPTTLPSVNSGVHYSEIDSIQWSADSTKIYGSNSNTHYDFYLLDVSTNGLSVAADYPGVFALPIGIPAGNIHYDSTTSTLYNDNGVAINPSTGAVTGNFGLDALMVPDGALNYAYFIYQNAMKQNVTDYTIEAFNLTTFTPISSIIIPGVAGIPVKLIRWGTNGLAFLTMNDTVGGTPPVVGVYLVSGAFVTSPATVIQ